MKLFTIMKILFLFIICSPVFSRDLRYGFELNNLCLEDQILDNLKNHSYTGSACPALIEKKQLIKFRSNVKRINSTSVQILLLNSKYKQIKDENTQPDSKWDRKFYFRDYVKEIGSYIFQYEAYEDSGFVFYSEVTGREYSDMNLPIINKSNAYMAINTSDIGSMSPPSEFEISIYKVEKGDLIKKWSLKKQFEKGVYRNVSWLSNTELVFHECNYDTCSTQPKKVSLGADGKWVLEPDIKD